MFRDSETGLVFHRGYIARSMFVVRLIQVVNFLFGVLYTLFATRFILEYIQARPVRFTELIAEWSQPFYRPFQGIVSNGHDGAGHPIAWSIVIAAAAFALLHAGIVGLLRMLNRPHHETD